jgi:alpha/beta superfamily hydrolase
VNVELAKTVTRDGLRLDGIFQAADAGLPTSDDDPAARTALMLHGAGSNFYAGGLFEQLTPSLLRRGIHVLRVNTRGHDGYYTGRASGGITRLGAAYECVADCSLDIAAWLRWLESRELGSAVLVGHSLGAIKAIYSQATEPSPAVAGILAISPPRLSCSAFQWGPYAESFGALLRDAKRLVAERAGHTVIESTFPFPMLITANAFLDKYGGETYNVVRLAGQIRQPLTFLYGEVELREGGVAFAGVPDALHQQRRPDQQLDIQTVEGADHFYVGCHEALRQHVEAAWPAFCCGSGEERSSVGRTTPDGL